jgi:Winged helix DNA-binding domain
MILHPAMFHRARNETSLMDERDIVRRRMRNTGLIGTPASDWRDVVRSFGAMQAQDYGPAKWSLGQRVRGLTDADMDRALDDGKILRTHALRPTWHFVLPEDILWILKLTGPRIHISTSTAFKELAIDAKLGARSNRAVARALRGGNHLTRKELQAVLAKSGIETDSRRLGFLMSYAEIEGVICSGARRGKQQTYALIEERAPNARNLAPDEALAELTFRYFTSHGPATIKDYRWWSSLKVTDIRRGIEMLGDKLRTDEVGGKTYFSTKGSTSTRVSSPTVHLLQAYDEYLVAYTDSKPLLNLSGIARSTSDRTLYLGVVTLDGQIAGNWKRTITKNSVKFDVVLYRLFRGEKATALRKAVDGHGAFLGLPADLIVSRFPETF